MAEFLGHALKDWLPQEPNQGPPLPEFLNIYWPWVKKELPPEEQPPAGAADIRVENLTISPAQVNVGDKVTVSITATNYGTASGSKTITLSVDGTTSSQTVTLAPSQSQQINFEVTTDVAKVYQVSVDGLTGSFKAVAAAYPIVFTGATISPISVLAGSGWWGTSYYAVAQMLISWNAAHRVPEVEGSGSGQINVTWKLTKGAAVQGPGSYVTTPQTRETTGAQYYYFPAGGGSVGWPYAGMQLSWGSTPPERGLYNYTINLKALVGGVIVGENTFSGTVQVS